MEDTDPWANSPSTPKPDNSQSHPLTPTLTKSPISNQGRTSFESPLKSSSPIVPVAVPVEGTNSSTLSPELEHSTTAIESAQEEAEAGAEDDGFDDFDDFDQPAVAGPSSPTIKKDDDGFGDGDGDGFGDFGDFEEGDFDEPSEVITAPALVAEPETIQERWHALRLRPVPPRSELLDQLSSVLEPLYDPATQYLTDEQPRIGTGLSQVLTSESSRDAYAQLTTAPMLKPLDWTRSRVRREHLISMGVPVNLDEVDSHRLSALPPLRITTMGPPGVPVPRRAESLDVDGNGNGNGRYTAIQKGKGKGIETSASPINGSQSVPNSAGGYNRGSKALGQYGLGQKPELDQAKAEDLCGLEEGQLSILPITTLRKMQEELVTNTAQASALLAWLLQMKDAQTQDSATYNGMISELIANAAKVKSAQAAGSGGVFRRASTKQRPQSTSGTVTPRRTASPGMWS